MRATGKSISDKDSFKRKVFQVIASTPFVQLEKGTYILTAKVKNSSGFPKLDMYASSGGKVLTHCIKEVNATWKTIRIEIIPVRDGKIEVGFTAHGTADAFCYVDDVSLLKFR